VVPKERDFDRKIDWYERMIRAAHSLARAIEIATKNRHEVRLLQL
jgi:hypothetical protein